ncbi:MAG: ABC transporter substrate-binding protein [Gammaproteobacteria bacterium]|nr:MAG: ABC transporter substrate-binding protein [Gammaproteobacteria bacterium]RTZ75969.1 MAG: ABC transporter substrate-binding protein [Gammaproteobacteria bacterium]RTZ81833.1 MAG: ABC transporter substrate-binding protein [Gammaproteobacteria bacterium]
MKGFLVGLVSLMVLMAGIPLQAKEQSAQELVRSTADYVLSQVRARKAELEKDGSGIYALVQEKVIPHFDFRIMTRAALGRYWRQASEEQKERLTREFRELLVRTYATMLLGYSDEKIEYLPFRGKPGDKRVIVRTRVHTSDGAPPVPIDYRLYRKNGEWKVYDVVVDGVSLVSNYRGTFANEVRKGGIEGLIASLEEHNRKLRNG